MDINKAITEEVWKPIVGHEESYEISSFGRLRSLDRQVNSKVGTRGTKGQIIKTKIDKYGYEAVALYSHQKGWYTTIHRLVASAFLPNPEKKATVNHKDANKLNNHVDNLEWNTNLENMRHANKMGLRDHVYRRGEDNNFTKLKKEDILYIRKNYNKKTLNLERLGEMFNVNPSNISQILARKTWKHI